MEKKKDYTKICISIDSELLSKVRKIADDKRMKITNFIEDVLLKSFKTSKKG